MKNFNKNLNIALIGGLVGLILMTLAGPWIVRQLVIAPVSFGVNCEPDIVYSMQKLIICQIIGLILGIIFTFLLRYKIFGGKTQPPADTNV